MRQVRACSGSEGGASCERCNALMHQVIMSSHEPHSADYSFGAEEESSVRPVFCLAACSGVYGVCVGAHIDSARAMTEGQARLMRTVTETAQARGSVHAVPWVSSVAAVAAGLHHHRPRSERQRQERSSPVAFGRSA